MRSTPISDSSAKTKAPLWTALISPVWVACLLLLVVNDHVLKHLYPGALTGKLSDFAGLFIAPALLALLLGVRSKRGLIACGVAVGAVFSAINLSATAALLWDGAMSTLLLPFHTTVDPTDLLALPALALGVLHAMHHRQSRPATQATAKGISRRRPALALAAVATVACAASGGPTDPTPQEYTGTVTILNKTNEMHRIEIYSLDQNIFLDCDRVADNPDAMLADELFEGNFPRVVPLFSGEEVALDPNEWSNNWGWEGQDTQSNPNCRAFLVRSRVLPDVLVFWRPQDFFSRTYFHNREAPQELDSDAPTIAIDADYSGVEDPEQLHGWREITCPLDFNETEWEQCNGLDPETIAEAERVPEGARYSLRSINNNVPLHFERPRFESGGTLQIPARCRIPGPGEGLEWERIGSSLAYELERVEQGVDGCHTLHITPNNQEPTTLLICGPWEAISKLQPPEDVKVMVDFADRANELQIDINEGWRELGFGRMYLRRGHASTVLKDYPFEEEVRIGCDPLMDQCGEVSLPVDLRFDADGGEKILVGPGESADFGSVRGELFLARAAYKPIRNLDCAGDDNINTLIGVYAETITITP